MLNGIESRIPRIMLKGSKDLHLRSIDERNGVHCIGETAEPMSQLTRTDKEEYYVLLRRLHVPKGDVQKGVDRIDTDPPAVPIIKGVLHEFASLIRPYGQSFSRVEPIAVEHRESVIYKRQR